MLRLYHSATNEISVADGIRLTKSLVLPQIEVIIGQTFRIRIEISESGGLSNT